MVVEKPNCFSAALISVFVSAQLDAVCIQRPAATVNAERNLTEIIRLRER